MCYDQSNRSKARTKLMSTENVSCEWHNTIYCNYRFALLFRFIDLSKRQKNKNVTIKAIEIVNHLYTICLCYLYHSFN